MTARLLLEVWTGATWKLVGTLDAGDPGGSLSNRTPTGRDIIRFSCHDDGSLIERSLGGLDLETRAAREITTRGFELLARLAGDGDTYELDLQTDRMLVPVKARFRHQARA